MSNSSNLPALIPFAELERMGVVIAKSGLFGMKTPEQAIALLLVAQSEGVHPAAAAMSYDIISNRPAKKTEAMLRDFLRGGGRVEWHVLSDTEAAATFSHPQGGSVRIDWDMQRAKAAGIGSREMWLKWPRQMLRSRCVSEGIRTIYPLATSGMYVPEEAADIDRRPPRDITPPKATAAADALADFAGDPPPSPGFGAASAATAHDPDTGEVIEDGADRPHFIPIQHKDGVSDWAGWCADLKSAYVSATDEDTLTAIRDQNKEALTALAAGGAGGRKAADKLQGTYNGCLIELQRIAAAAA